MGSVFFYYLDLQIVKIDGVHEIILIKPGLAVSLELSDSGVQPDGLAEVKVIAYLIQRPEDLVVRVSSPPSQTTVSLTIRPPLILLPINETCVPSFLRYLSNHYSTGMGQKEEAAASGCLRKKEIREKR